MTNTEEKGEVPELAKNLQDIFQKQQEDIEQHNTDVRTRSRPYETLIVPVECSVQSVVGSSRETTLEVVTNTAVKTLKFYGLPSLEQGDKIRAYVFKGEEVYEKLRDDPFDMWKIPSASNRCYQPKPQSHYVERDFKEKELVVKIEKRRKNKVVATYLSISPPSPSFHRHDVLYR